MNFVYDKLKSLHNNNNNKIKGALESVDMALSKEWMNTIF